MSNIGTKIYGYCEGYFGRDDYGAKIIVAEGRKWIVCSYLYADNDYVTDYVTCANFDTEEEKEECIKRWSEEENLE